MYKKKNSPQVSFRPNFDEFSTKCHSRQNVLFTKCRIDQMSVRLNGFDQMS